MLKKNALNIAHSTRVSILNLLGDKPEVSDSEFVQARQSLVNSVRVYPYQLRYSDCTGSNEDDLHCY